MLETMVPLDHIDKVYGDRVLVKRLAPPEKKLGIYLPVNAIKKEPKKVWWAEVEAFGHESRAQEDGITETMIVGIEPLGNHYASFKGDDGSEHVWVPDEHLCLIDDGTVADYYADRHDSDKPPRLSLIGNRVMVREVPTKEGPIHRVDRGDEREAKLSEVLLIGKVDEERGLRVGAKVLHVAEEAGTSCLIDLYTPPLIVLRAEDLIARVTDQPRPRDTDL